MKTCLSAFLVVALLSGCSHLDQIPDDEFSADLQKGSKSVVKYALQAALRKVDATAAARIQADAKVADDIITKNIVPIFSGAQTADILRSAVDTALGLLKNKLTDARVIAAIDLAVEVIVMEVKLPSNPAAKLDLRTTKALNGIFSGISAGIEAVFPPQTPAIVSPTTPRDPISVPK